MIKIQTYRLEPFYAAGTARERLTTEWLRDAINLLMRNKREKLEKEQADTSLFFNHIPDTGHPRIGYPLIIYHYIEGLFYITGINEGVLAIDSLAKHYKSSFSMDGIVFQGFHKKKSDVAFKLETTAEMQSYRLIEWRPIHHDSLNAFMQMDLATKVNELNLRLEKHIVNELGKYLAIGFDQFNCVITDVTRVYEPQTYKKRFKYPAFDICFSANVALPEMITLGNHQALGFGRIEPK